jgi:soluble lytic murein transglycosylase-like protein
VTSIVFLYRILILLTILSSHARAATSTERALLALCPTTITIANVSRSAQAIDSAARRHMVHPCLIVALIRAESHCKPWVIGARGEVGLGQLRGVARGGLSRQQLLDPGINIMATARWLAEMQTMCGDDGLRAYNSGRCGKPTRYVRKLRRFERMARR